MFGFIDSLKFAFMAEKNNITKEQDLGEILREKLLHHQTEWRTHQDKAVYHTEQASFHRDRTEYITNILKDMPAAPANDLVKPESNYTQMELYTKSWWWVKRVKELNISGEFTRGKLFELDGLNWEIANKDFKGKVGYAASIALGELVEANYLSARDEIGTKGKIYKVKKIN